MDDLLRELGSLGFRSEQIVLLGFSQGACLLAQYALMHPARYRGVAILTGGYIGPPGVDWSFKGDMVGTPVLVTTSLVDEWVPPARAVETAHCFEKLGATVQLKLFDDRPHEVSDEEILLLKQLIPV
jgi:predicted esterase